jgi:hypothetical protein
LEKYRRGSRSTDTRYKPEQEAPINRLIKTISENSKQPLGSTEKIPVAEKDLLHAIIEGGNDIADFAFQNFPPNEFAHPVARLLAEQIKKLRDTGNNSEAATLLDFISASTASSSDIESMKHLISELVFSKYELSKRWGEGGTDVSKGDVMQIVKAALKTIKKQSIQKLLVLNQELMKEAKNRGEDLMPYLQRANELLNQKKNLDPES